MKKVVLFSALILLSFNQNFAQGKFRFGVNGGMTYSGLRGNDQVERFNNDIDFLAGISLEFQLKERLSLVANINYDRKTVSQKLNAYIITDPDFAEFEGDIKIKLKNQFISLPILVKYKFGKVNSFFINGGPFFSYLLKSQLWNDYDEVNTDNTDSFKKIDYGIAVGIGKSFMLKNGNEILIEIRENLGLRNISDRPIVNDGTIKTNSLNLIGTYSFDFK